MNLRTLKKLSKRAAPLLPLLGDRRKQFPAGRDDSYFGLIIRERKHWERGRSPHADCFDSAMIKHPARDGKGGWVYIVPPSHPRKGTIMVGAMSGYEQPEWDEETAWESLCDIVYWHFTDWRDDDLHPTRVIRTPSEVFAAARQMLSTAPK